MHKFILSKKVRLIGGLILFGSFYAFHFRQVDHASQEASFIENPVVTPTVAPSNIEPEKISKDSLQVRGASILLGDSTKKLIKAFGVPGRIDAAEDNYDYYIYNNDYSRMAFIAVRDDKVMGFYSNSEDFRFHDIRYGDDINQVNSALGKKFIEAAVLTYETDTYTAKILMDQLETHKVIGIYVLSKEEESSASEGKSGQYTDIIISNIEQMSYDLVNSYRRHHDLPPLSWSSSAAASARKHSAAMAAKDFFDHIDPELRTPQSRLFAEGIGYSDCSENIVGGYGNAILSGHAVYNSDKQRRNILSKVYRYVGIGFAYDAKSKYHDYYTQIFYR
jgi:uncharacterized protein YkwD